MKLRYDNANKRKYMASPLFPVALFNDYKCYVIYIIIIPNSIANIDDYASCIV